MGIYAVTGATKGIGEQALSIIRSHGHEAINIDIDGGDINADLGTVEGREKTIAELHKRCPEGLDGLVCNHGIAGIPRFKRSYLLSVNYFGAVRLFEGVFDLLKMRRGNCVATVSGAISHTTREKYFVDALLTNCGDEERIGRLVDSFPFGDNPYMHGEDGNIMYMSSKIALANWVRRIASSWAARGVNVNAVAPGVVDTTIMHGFEKPDGFKWFYPMPVRYDVGNKGMDPKPVAQAIAFLAMPESKGVNGVVLYCDSGQNAIVDPDMPF